MDAPMDAHNAPMDVPMDAPAPAVDDDPMDAPAVDDDPMDGNGDPNDAVPPPVAPRGGIDAPDRFL